MKAAVDAAVTAAILAILRRYYGPRSEKFDPRQLLLFGELLEQMPLDAASVADEAGEQLATRRIKNRHKHGRKPLPEQLERIKIEHDLDDKNCPACGCQRCRIGAEITEQLEYFPAVFKVLQHIRHKYACGKCHADGYNPNIQSAPQPIAKGLPGPSLLAYVITSKLGDHLPLYRRENIFARQGVEIARSTMCAWMRAAGDLVVPLVELLASRVKQSQVIHTDDTPVPIQSPGAKQCRKGRIWCYVGDAAHPYVAYDYTPSRARAGPAERAMKRVAIGRKNWPGTRASGSAGNDAAAQNHARLWSLIASCERHGVDPQRYLTSVFAKIGQLPRDAADQIPVAELVQFLPDVWKKEDAAEPLAPEPPASAPPVAAPPAKF